MYANEKGSLFPHTSANVPATYTQYDDVIAILRVHYTLNNSYTLSSPTYTQPAVFVCIFHFLIQDFPLSLHIFVMHIVYALAVENITCFCFVEFSIYLHLYATFQPTLEHALVFIATNDFKDFPKLKFVTLQKMCVYMSRGGGVSENENGKTFF